MAKKRTAFFCNSCGAESARWYGRCPVCGEWNTLVEETIVEEKSSAGKQTVKKTSARPAPLNGEGGGPPMRVQLGIPELDAVLGGGLVHGSSVLLGGEPGIGKSTLLLQAASAMAKASGSVLYITGEESLEQIRMRAQRLGVLSDKVFILAENNLDNALEQAAQMDIRLLIVDSVQAVYLPDISSAPGSVSQVRAVAAACLQAARNHDLSLILVGHVTKEGTLAGPRVLEHMVDTVLYFEGERYTAFRLLRAVKNRFGSTNELGVFEMGEHGLSSLANPSLLFLGEKKQGAAGSSVTCIMQGSRPLLLEIQALVAPTAFGNPRRLAVGFDYNRLLIIIAILERKLGLSLGNQDVYINIAGGLRVDDPAADLAVATAICSALKGLPLPDKLVLFGELGLLGEIRTTGQLNRRAKEAASFGFNEIVCPKFKTEKNPSIKFIFADDLPHALKILNLI